MSYVTISLMAIGGLVVAGPVATVLLFRRGLKEYTAFSFSFTVIVLRSFLGALGRAGTIHPQHWITDERMIALNWTGLFVGFVWSVVVALQRDSRLRKKDDL